MIWWLMIDDVYLMCGAEAGKAVHNMNHSKHEKFPRLPGPGKGVGGGAPNHTPAALYELIPVLPQWYPYFCYAWKVDPDTVQFKHFFPESKIHFLPLLLGHLCAFSCFEQIPPSPQNSLRPILLLYIKTQIHLPTALYYKKSNSSWGLGIFAIKSGRHRLTILRAVLESIRRADFRNLMVEFTW